MFCSECGAKCKKTDTFCGECGSKIETEEVKSKKTSAPKKEVSKEVKKKNKVLITVLVVVGVILAYGCYFLSELTSPKKVAKTYIDAVLKQDGEKLYQYIELEGDKTFVSKKLFKEALKTEEKPDVVNYKITKVEYGDGKLTAKVTYTYTVKDSSNEKTGYVNLVKGKGKKYIFFDKWEIDNLKSANFVVKEYEVKVAHNAKLEVASIKVKSKYLDKDKSDDDYDVYVLPQVFNKTLDIKATLENGLVIEEIVKPSSYYNKHTVSFNKDSMKQDVKDNFIKTAKEDLKVIYEGALEDKSFDDIKNKFEHDDINLEELEEDYNNLKDRLSNEYNKLQKIKFKDGYLSNISINEDGNVEMAVSLTYDYTVKYTMYEKEQEASKSSSGRFELEYKYEKGNYYLVNLESLVTYFSRY